MGRKVETSRPIPSLKQKGSTTPEENASIYFIDIGRPLANAIRQRKGKDVSLITPPHSHKA